MDATAAATYTSRMNLVCGAVGPNSATASSWSAMIIAHRWDGTSIECIVLGVYLVGECGHADDRDVVASGSESLHGAVHESVGAPLSVTTKYHSASRLLGESGVGGAGVRVDRAGWTSGGGGGSGLPFVQRDTATPSVIVTGNERGVGRIKG